VLRATKFYSLCFMTKPITMAARSKTSVCGHPLAGIEGSNPDGSVDVDCMLAGTLICSQRTIMTYT